MNIAKIDENTAVVDSKYIITRTGDVFRYHSYHHKWEPQKKRVHTNGYLRAVINGHDAYIHRLVATAFCDNPRGCSEVNHIDGNKQNNDASNLEWCTRSENNRHAFMTGLRDYAELREMSKKGNATLRKKRRLTTEQVKEIRKRKAAGETSAQIGADYGIGRQTVDSIWHRTAYKDVI